MTHDGIFGVAENRRTVPGSGSCSGTGAAFSGGGPGAGLNDPSVSPQRLVQAVEGLHLAGVGNGLRMRTAAVRLTGFRGYRDSRVRGRLSAPSTPG
ncbi:hypothetical protein GCM10010129_00300 [Streptomyces fumigatiscleroticus]|nr:hypothetical protein GCM10010129_00300 [Streptomyces fumigatiscleroticus]